MTWTRRRLVLAGAGVLSGLAGCTTFLERTASSGNGEPTPTVTGSNATTELDLREANVVGVDVERTNGAVEFAVTLHHDDDGEEGYANWWQVETLAGEQLGRRVLTHPHSSQPFTRSDTVEIGSDVSCVVVRGHDQTHGYGGQAMLVTVATGATRPMRQGPSRTSVADADCP
jgi:hypothetical protein